MTDNVVELRPPRPLRAPRDAIEIVLALHQPYDEEAEFWWDDGPSVHCTPKCSDRTCNGHTAIVQVCTECGYEHDGDGAVFRSWPCPTVVALTDVTPTDAPT